MSSLNWPAEKIKTWFITGCSTGLGKALCEYLLPKGYKVIATVRNKVALIELEAQFPNTLLVLELDVTQKEAVQAAVKQAISWAGNIQVLVNNAGYGLIGNFEGMADAQIRHQMETNFMGPVFLYQAFLPHFRAEGLGHILNISSVAGVSANPGGVIYSASKFALEALSEGMNKEAAHFNIRSTIIEPGPFRTDWAGRSLVVPEIQMPEYEESVGKMHAYLEQVNGKQKGDPMKAAWAMEQVVLASDPPTRLPIGVRAVDIVAGKGQNMKDEVAAWQSVSIQCDFPD